MAIGDVWTFNSPTTSPFVNGSSYTVTGVTIYTTATTTIGGVTFTVGPDLVTLSGVTTISVDWLTGNFTRTTAASPVSPYGNQIPAHVRGGRDDVNTTRPSDKSANLAKVRRDAERRDRPWRLRDEEAERRKKASP